jgi:hypothetical protein
MALPRGFLYSGGMTSTSKLPEWLARNRTEAALRREAEEFNAAATRAMYARVRTLPVWVAERLDTEQEAGQ